MITFSPDKLYVEYRGITEPEYPIIPRRYTLTHSDVSGEMYLVIGPTYAYERINPDRDEVLAEWQLAGNRYIYAVYLYIDGRTEADASIRNAVFRRELPLALQAIRYGDREFFNTHPSLDLAPIIVHFISNYPEYNRIENWGTPAQYRNLAFEE